MKKLMIAAAIVCAAAFAQAATIKWTSNAMALTDANGTAISALDKGSLVLVSMATATDWANAVEIPTKSTEGTTVSISSREANLGQVSGTLKFAYTSGGAANLVDNGDYLALMYKDENGKLNQLTYTSGPNDGDPVAAAWQVADLVNDGTSLNGKVIPMSGNFTAVPEPTSGLLLLLGVAGLALRRRRA